MPGCVCNVKALCSISLAATVDILLYNVKTIPSDFYYLKQICRG